MSAAEGLINQVESLYGENADLRAATGGTTTPEVIAYIRGLEGTLATLIQAERRRLNDQSQLIINTLERL